MSYWKLSWELQIWLHDFAHKFILWIVNLCSLERNNDILITKEIFFSPEISEKDKITKNPLQNPNKNPNQQNKQNSNKPPLNLPSQTNHVTISIWSALLLLNISQPADYDNTPTIIFSPRSFKDMMAIFLLSQKYIERKAIIIQSLKLED